MSAYINKVKSAPSWSSPRDYIHKEPKPEKVKEKVDDKSLTASKEVEEIEKKRFGFFSKKEENSPEKEVETKEESKPEEEKVNVNEMLDGIVKKKRGRRFFLAEKDVDKDLFRRQDI